LFTIFQVVLKRLGHNNELEELDNQILKLSKPEPNNLRSDISFAIRQFTNQHLVQKIIPDLQGSGGKTVYHLKIPDAVLPLGIEKSSEILVCPSQRKFNLIENQFVKNNRGVNRLVALYNVMTLLILNSEPLLFQVSYLQY